MPKPVLKEQLWGKALWITLISVNVFVLLLCLGVTITGLWARFSVEPFVSITGQASITRTCLAVAVVGVCSSLLTLFGILGSFIFSSIPGRILLTVYAFVLLFLIAVEVGAGNAAMKFGNNVESGIQHNTVRSLNQSYADLYNTSWNKWDNFQQDMECCGAQNYTDFFKLFNHTTVVPRSCCTATAKSNGTCSKNFSNATIADIHTKPCLDVISSHLRPVYMVLAITTIIISALQISGIVLSTLAVFSVVLTEDKRTYSYQKLSRGSRASSENNA